MLFPSSGSEPEIVGAATPIDILGDLVIPVATIAHLIATKVLAGDDHQRPQDRVDLRSGTDTSWVIEVEVGFGQLAPRLA